MSAISVDVERRAKQSLRRAHQHLEHPRAFVRELVRITKPGGSVLLRTPDQLSALSVVTLGCRSQHGTTPRHSRVCAPRCLSDNLALIGRRCVSHS